MSKVATIAASLKAVLFVAAGALAQGYGLPVILISAIFDLGLQIRREAGYTERRPAPPAIIRSQKGTVVVDDSGGSGTRTA